MGAILLPPSGVGYTAPVAQQIRVPVLATTDAAILRFEAANAALHLGVRCAESPCGRSTAPGTGAGWRAPVRTRLRHSRSSSDRVPSVSSLAICSRQADIWLATVALLTTSPGSAQLPSRRCSASSTQPCMRLTCMSGLAQATRSARIVCRRARFWATTWLTGPPFFPTPVGWLPPHLRRGRLPRWRR
jgi:hypothetical protein